MHRCPPACQWASPSNLQLRPHQPLEAQTKSGGDEIAEKVKANLAKLPPEDQKLAAQQKFCPITGLLLGSMGVPVKIMLKDQTRILLLSRLR